jgi:hypothetical protein
MNRKVTAGIALAVLAFGPSTARAEAVTGECAALPRTSYTVSADYYDWETNSTAFVAMPEATVDFTQHGSQPACVIVRFSAETLGFGTTQMIVRPLLDKSVVNPGTSAVPGAAVMGGREFASDVVDTVVPLAHSYDFLFPSVAPGPHRIVMQWRVLNDKGVVYTYRHSTIVQHK